MNKPRVGDKLYVVCLKKKDRSYWCKVTKVGRKYFYIETETIPEWQEVRFSIDDWRHDHGNCGSPDYSLYVNKADYDESVLATRLSFKIRRVFEYFRPSGVTNEPMFAIADILNIKLTDDN